MAKRKLSLQQRQSVRKDLRQLLARKLRQVDILRAIAKKYGITPITARWYYHSIVRPKRPASAGKAKSPRDMAHRPPQPAPETSLRVVYRVQSITEHAEKDLKRVLEAKKLIPQWRVYVEKEAALKKLESKVKTDLREVSIKASRLQRRIRALTSR
jgi:hypothetical protein